MNGVNAVLTVFDSSLKEIDLLYGSERFNDILPDGTRVSDMTDSDIVLYIKNTNKDKNKKLADYILNEENDDNILDGYYLTVECTCGLFHGFKNQKEIPDEDLKCGICGKTLILYTHRNDSDYIYDGSTKIDLLTSSSPGDSEYLDSIIKDIFYEDSNSEIKQLNFLLNKKQARVEVLKKILKDKLLNDNKRIEINTELILLNKEISGLSKMIDDLDNLDNLDEIKN
jgi:hypothetical protein